MKLETKFGTIEASEETFNWLSLALGEAADNMVKKGYERNMDAFNFRSESDKIYYTLKRRKFYDRDKEV